MATHKLELDGNRYLRLHLHELILHVENDLLDHLGGLFRAVDQVVEIGPQQSADPFDECHCDSPLKNIWPRMNTNEHE